MGRSPPAEPNSSSSFVIAKSDGGGENSPDKKAGRQEKKDKSKEEKKARKLAKTNPAELGRDAAQAIAGGRVDGEEYKLYSRKELGWTFEETKAYLMSVNAGVDRLKVTKDETPAQTK